MKYIRRYFHNVFLSRRWYRRRLGGKWYKVVDPFQAGFQGTVFLWVRDPEDREVVKVELYP